MWQDVKDFVSQNKGKIGGILLAVWLTASGDDALVAKYPRLFAYAGAAVSAIFGGGIMTSDRHKREEKALKDIFEDDTEEKLEG